MKSVVDRLRLAASSSSRSSRSKGSLSRLAWEQTPDGKWIKADDRSQINISELMSENPLFTPANSASSSNTFKCDVCDTVMSFQKYTYVSIKCSICNQLCGDIQLVCETCGLCVCCSPRSKYVSSKVWKPSCYSSYFDLVEPAREKLYTQDLHVSEFAVQNQQRWLQCMWHDITQNRNRFRTELWHVSQVETQNMSMVIDNLGAEVLASLVRLFVIFQTKFNVEIVQWFSNLIQCDRESLGQVALETSVSLKDRGRLEQLQWLVREIGIDASNSNLTGALEIAVKLGSLEKMVCLLEDAGLDPSVDRNLAIRIASARGYLNVVERLLQDVRVDPAANNNFAIRYASESGHLNVVDRLLLDTRVDPSADENYAIRSSSLEGHLSVVERLLEDTRVDPSAENNFAIQWASRNGKLDVVERLLRVGRVDPSANDNAAIRWASSKGYLDVVVRLLRDVRVDPSDLDNNAIQAASSFGHLHVVEELLQDVRVDPTAKDNCAIRNAACSGQLKVVERLLRDVRVDPSADGNSAIQSASESGYSSVVNRLLQDARVDPSANYNYAIRYASSEGRLNVVERLLQDDRVDPSADDNYAIRYASWKGHLPVVERLLQDDRVDPNAQGCEAIRAARDATVLECLYRKTSSVVCFMISDEHLMGKLKYLHSESLMMGGLCLSHTGRADSHVTTLPQDVVLVILMDWATLMTAKSSC